MHVLRLAGACGTGVTDGHSHAHCRIAQVYFSAEQHERLVDALLAFGESQLGCRAITPIWMSYYTEGMFQELHCDNPHGPFAFVLSLTSE